MSGKGTHGSFMSLGKKCKPILVDDHDVLRKDGNGTSLVAIAKHPAIT